MKDISIALLLLNIAFLQETRIAQAVGKSSLPTHCKWKFSNCLQCTAINCILCRRGYYRAMMGYGIRCVLRCPKGTIIRNDECIRRRPVPDPVCGYNIRNCEYCSSKSLCTRCKSGYYHYNGGCILRCPQGYYTAGRLCKRGCGYSIPNCHYCASKSACTRCYSGYYNFNGQCTKNCPLGYYAAEGLCKQGCGHNIPNCDYCISQSACTRCQSGYYHHNGRCTRSCPLGYYASGKVCRRGCGYNIPNCDYCISQSTCTRCRPGYYRLNGRCTRKCPRGYYPAAQLCKRGCGYNIPNCDYCTSKSTCTRCQSGYYRYNGRCTHRCPLGYYVAGNLCRRGCGYNILNCDYCTSKSACTRCQSGYYHYNGQCTHKCPLGYYAAGNLCKRGCGYNIPNCDYCTSKSACRRCQSGYYHYNGRCTHRCPLGYYATGRLCKRGCGFNLPHCDYCRSRSACTRCQPGYYHYNSGCIRTCPQGYYATGNLCKRGCRYNIPNCDFCTPKFVCTRCQSGYYHHNGRCTRSCPLGYYASGKVCRRGCGYSIPYCDYCTSRSACTRCRPGYYHLNGRCTRRCPPGYYAAANLCKRGCGHNIPNCDYCISQSACTRCQSGYYNYNGRCTHRCPLRYYPAGNVCKQDPCTIRKPCASKPYSICRPVNGRAVCLCNFGCTRDIRYVCGSDGVTYANECIMRKRSCETGRMTTVAKQGRCVDPCTVGNPCRNKPYSICRPVNGGAVCLCNFGCTENIRYVCGSDRVTYANECIMRKRSCETGRMITVVKQGRCVDPCTVGNPCVNKPYSTCRPVNGRAVCSCNFLFCSKDIRYVCGSDGVTYANECIMRRKSCETGRLISVAKQGRCVDPCTVGNPCRNKPYSICRPVNGLAVCLCNFGCTRGIRYVCGSDRVTYANECIMRERSCETGRMITVVKQGRCVDPCTVGNPCVNKPYSTCRPVNGRAVCSCNFLFCSKDIRYVCGSDGVTYANECIMRKRSCETERMTTVVKQGRCVDPCTVGNPCRNKPYSICRPVNGRAVCLCNFGCTEDIRYVCGSDGVTYANDCVMRRRSCETGRWIRVAKQGRCVDPCTVGNPCANKPYSICRPVNGGAVCLCNYTCIKDIRYVCGSDGVTYANECIMRRKSCETGMLIRVAKQGQCDPCSLVTCSRPYEECSYVNNQTQCQCPRSCPTNYDPVCGSDYILYTNECLLRLRSCVRNRPVTVVERRFCFEAANPCDPNPCRRPHARCINRDGQAVCQCERACDQGYHPVCGSDGIRYSNLCSLKVASCQINKVITVSENGACASDLCARIRCMIPQTQCRIVKGRAECVHVCDRNCPIPQYYDHVCGSDGQTYASACILRQKACETNSGITLGAMGECRWSDCRVVSNCFVCPWKRRCLHCPGGFELRLTTNGRDVYCHQSHVVIPHPHQKGP